MLRLENSCLKVVSFFSREVLGGELDKTRLQNISTVDWLTHDVPDAAQRRLALLASLAWAGVPAKLAAEDSTLLTT